MKIRVVLSHRIVLLLHRGGGGKYVCTYKIKRIDFKNVLLPVQVAGSVLLCLRNQSIHKNTGTENKHFQ